MYLIQGCDTPGSPLSCTITNKIPRPLVRVLSPFPLSEVIFLTFFLISLFFFLLMTYFLFLLSSPFSFSSFFCSPFRFISAFLPPQLLPPPVFLSLSFALAVLSFFFHFSSSVFRFIRLVLLSFPCVFSCPSLHSTSYRSCCLSLFH